MKKGQPKRRDVALMELIAERLKELMRSQQLLHLQSLLHPL